MKPTRLLSLFLLFATSTTYAASLTWDADTVTTGAQDGTGAWSPAGTNWWNGTANQAFATGDNITFGAAAGAAVANTVTLGSSVSAANASFGITTLNSTPRYTLDLGGNTLTVTGQLTFFAQSDAYYTATTNGVVQLANPASTQAAPDIFFDPNDGADYGAVIASATNVGTGTRFFRAAPQRNEVARYSGDLRFNGALTGSANIALSGTTVDSNHNAHFVFNSASPAFTGGVTINDNADLALTHNAALGSANPVTFGNTAARGGLFLFGHNVTIGTLNDVSTGGTRWIRNGSTVATNGGTNTANNASSVALGVDSDAVLTISQSAGGVFGGVISDGPNDTGTGAAGTYRKLGITKEGAGVLTLTGANLHTGPTTINAGTLQIGNGTAVGSLAGTAIVNNATLAYQHSDSLTVANVITGTGTIAQRGSGSLRFSVTTALGGLALEAGQLEVGAAADTIGTLSATAVNQTGGNLALDLSPTSSDTLTVSGNYTHTSGSIQVKLLGTPAVGTPYTLVNYGGTLSAHPPVVLNATQSRLSTNVDYGTGTNSSIKVTFSGVTGNVVWTGQNGNAWDLNTLNWKSGNTPDKFFQLDTVLFNDTPVSGNFNPTLSTVLSPTSVSFNNTANTYTLSGSGSLDGVATFSKQGTGLVVVATTNTLTGDVTISEGTLQLGNGTAGGALGTGAMTLTGALVFNRTDSGVFANPVTGAGTIGHIGAGTTVVTSSLAQTGDITISAGTLQLGNGGGTGSIATANVINNGSLVVNRNAALALPGTLSGTGSLGVQGTGLVTLTGTNTYSGGTTLAGGALSINSGSALGTGALTITKAAGGDVLTVATNDAVPLANNLVLPAPASAQTYNLIKNTASTGGGTQVNLPGVISGGNANLTFFLNTNLAGDNTTTFRFAGANTFRGKLALNRGAMVVANAGAFGDPANLIAMDGNFNETLGDIRFEIPVTLANPFELHSRPISTTDKAVTLTGAFTGPGELNKLGTGVLSLSNSSIGYTGATTVTEGTLAINGVLTAGTAAVTVQGSGALAGSGTIARPVTVNGTIAPGNGVGTLNLTNGATLAGGSTYAFQLADWNGTAGTGFDQLATSALTITATPLSKFTVNVDGSTLVNFSDVTKTFVVATGAVTGLTADNWQVTTTNLSASGTWALQANGNQLELVYTQGGPTTYDTWAAALPGFPAELRAPQLDANGDGVPNYVSFVLNEHPAVSSRGANQPKSVRSGNNLVFSYTRRDDSESFTTQTVQYGSDLTGWTDVPIGSASAGMVVIDETNPVTDLVTVTIPIPAQSTRFFARLKIKH